MNRTARQFEGTRNRSGFTLIEVMLAVTLSAFLLGMISTAVYLNVRVLQQQQIEIERSQIARNVLASMTGDLRAGIQYKPADVTGLDALSVSQAAIAGLLGGMEGVDASAMAGMMGGAAEEETESTATQNIASGQTEVLRPGLYGNATEIMIDISRLPRIDQYNPLVVGSSSDAISLPTDVKTISYFVSEDSEASVQMQVGQDQGTGGGLFRRQLDRAVASFSSDLAASLATMGNTKLIAKEVIGIQFRYFDGEDWVTEWDSDEEGGFPAAVEITVLIDNERAIATDTPYRMEQNPETGKTYRTVVNLPVAEIISEEDESAEGSGR